MRMQKLITLIVISTFMGAVANATLIDFDLVASTSQNPASDIYTIDIVANFDSSWSGNGRVTLEYNQNYTTLESVTLVNADSWGEYILCPGGINIDVDNRSLSGSVIIATIELKTTTSGTYFYVRDDSNTSILKSHLNTDFDNAGLVDNPAFDGAGVPNVDAIRIMSVPEPATICLLGLGVLGLLKKRRA